MNKPKKLSDMEHTFYKDAYILRFCANGMDGIEKKGEGPYYKNSQEDKDHILQYELEDD